MKCARSLNLRHPWVSFKTYLTRTSLVCYDLNLTLGCHRIYYLALLPALDPICPYNYGRSLPLFLKLSWSCNNPHQFSKYLSSKKILNISYDFPCFCKRSQISVHTEINLTDLKSTNGQIKYLKHVITLDLHWLSI